MAYVPGWTVQMHDPQNTARCATLIVAEAPGVTIHTANDWAARFAKVAGMRVVDIYSNVSARTARGEGN